MLNTSSSPLALLPLQFAFVFYPVAFLRQFPWNEVVQCRSVITEQLLLPVRTTRGGLRHSWQAAGVNLQRTDWGLVDLTAAPESSLTITHCPITNVLMSLAVMTAELQNLHSKQHLKARDQSNDRSEVVIHTTWIQSPYLSRKWKYWHADCFWNSAIDGLWGNDRLHNNFVWAAP